MKKFKYRLEPLLHIRRQQEDQKKRAVAKLLTHITKQQNQALALHQSLQDEGRILKQRHSEGVVDLQWVAHYRRYVTSVQRAISQRVDAVRATQGSLQGARAELVNAKRETRKLELLKEQRREAYLKELARRERITEDEIAAAFHRRQHAVTIPK